MSHSIPGSILIVFGNDAPTAAQVTDQDGWNYEMIQVDSDHPMYPALVDTFGQTVWDLLYAMDPEEAGMGHVGRTIDPDTLEIVFTDGVVTSVKEVTISGYHKNLWELELPTNAAYKPPMVAGIGQTVYDKLLQLAPQPPDDE